MGLNDHSGCNLRGICFRRANGGTIAVEKDLYHNADPRNGGPRSWPTCNQQRQNGFVAS